MVTDSLGAAAMARPMGQIDTCCPHWALTTVQYAQTRVEDDQEAG
jgi:hypothetical protein